ncbi:MAG: hypothetical protein ACK4MU_09160, partial [Thermomonas sp.]
MFTGLHLPADEAATAQLVLDATAQWRSAPLPLLSDATALLTALRANASSPVVGVTVESGEEDGVAWRQWAVEFVTTLGDVPPLRVELAAASHVSWRVEEARAGLLQLARSTLLRVTLTVPAPLPSIQSVTVRSQVWPPVREVQRVTVAAPGSHPNAWFRLRFVHAGVAQTTGRIPVTAPAMAADESMAAGTVAGCSSSTPPC